MTRRKAVVYAADAMEFRALRGRGIALVVGAQGKAVATMSFTFAEARELGAQLFQLADDYDEEAKPSRPGEDAGTTVN